MKEEIFIHQEVGKDKSKEIETENAHEEAMEFVEKHKDIHCIMTQCG